MLLYLIRHGQSEGNVSNFDVPDGNLTPLGFQQAREVAARLAGEGIDLIISSPLRRALQTADALARRTGVPHEVWQDLCEHRDNEPYRFLGRPGVKALCPDAICEEDYPEDGFDFGMETPEDAHARTLRMFARLQARFGAEEKRVALFAHGGFNAFFMMAAMGRPRVPGCWIEQHNCCVNRIWISPERIRIISMNETWHLSEVSY
ncbi:MAG TPA: histidine phosphatase family protein [Symbiobacteriaceae bacterium]|jgi:broad specificity phosphatase PhoE|nr:histidine phosphatase family protein [Symbiobacteriaceae bacterium]